MGSVPGKPPLPYEEFTRLGETPRGTEGGLYGGPGGGKWYLKYPSSERQAHNEVMASRFYAEMGFDTVQYELVDNGMVASRWRPDLPESSNPSDLAASETVREAFLPSALLANWDVIGLTYDNCLYDPGEMSEPVFLDFGGSFDTRALGGHKPFEPDDVAALEGFTNPSINQSASMVFSEMGEDTFTRSQARIGDLTAGRIRDVVSTVLLDGRERRVRVLRARRDLLLGTDYEDVFAEE